MFIDSGKADARLARALDTAWLREHLSQALWRTDETPGAIGEVFVRHVRESKKGVHMLYAVELNGHTPAREQMYVGYLVRPEELDEEYKSAQKKAKIQPAHGRAVVVIPEAALVLTAFPNDRKLTLLSETQMCAWLQEHWRKILPGKTAAAPGSISALTLTPLRYVPERRYTAHCRAWLQRENEQPENLSFVVKQVGDEKRAKRLYRNLLSLESALAQLDQVPFRVPRAWAWDESLAAVFLEYLPGENLKQLLFTLDLERMMPRVGETLAVFHRAPKRVRKRVSFQSELRENRETMRELAQALPQTRTRLRLLFENLQSLRWTHDRPPALLHGTYRLNHIFLHQDELVLLDLDSLRMGPPAYDIANFLTSLYYLEAQERIALELRQQIAQAFLSGYARATPAPIAPQMVLWFLASLMINKQAGKYVGHFHEDCEEKVARMLALAEAALQTAQTLRPSLTLPELARLLP